MEGMDRKILGPARADLLKRRERRDAKNDPIAMAPTSADVQHKRQNVPNPPTALLCHEIILSSWHILTEENSYATVAERWRVLKTL